jgi:hypothetical protein
MLLIAILACSLIVPTLVDSQAAPSPASVDEKLIAPGLAAIIRHTEKLEVPRKGKAIVAVDAALGSWSTTNNSREFTIPSQGFYIATLQNAAAVIVINGEEKLRQPGETWAVQDGQAMTVKIKDPKQENLSLEIFSIRTGSR